MQVDTAAEAGRIAGNGAVGHSQEVDAVVDAGTNRSADSEIGGVACEGGVGHGHHTNADAAVVDGAAIALFHGFVAGENTAGNVRLSVIEYAAAAALESYGAVARERAIADSQEAVVENSAAAIGAVVVENTFADCRHDRGEYCFAVSGAVAG